MPNTLGGKKFKRTKTGSQDESSLFFECGEDQLFARVLKMLGNCNIQVFSNDGKQRICHIRGKMRNRVRISVGDLVLISIRDFETTNDKAGELEKGDVLAKCDPSTYSQIKKTYKDKLHPLLFAAIEQNADGNVVIKGNDDDIFDYDETGHVEEVDTDLKNEVITPANQPVKYHKNYEHIQDNSDDFNIDDI
jgi:initiation factor 1A